MSAPLRPSPGAPPAQREAAAGGRSGRRAPAPRRGPQAARARSAAPPALVAGQAVVDGVMMRGEHAWAVAVRAGDGIRVTRGATASIRPHGPRTWPVVRGMAAVVEALTLGSRALTVAAGRRRAAALAAAFAVGLVVLFAVPALVAAALPASALLEGPLRIALLVAVLAVAARLPRLRRTLEYHGAEHKAVACHEAGGPLTPEAARRCARVHPRCGTSFLLTMLLVAMVAFIPLAALAEPLLVASRILAIPVVAGLAFELFRAAVRRPERGWARAVLRPGLRLQRLTTREPDDGQLAVALAALAAVLAPGAARGDGRPAA